MMPNGNRPGSDPWSGLDQWFAIKKNRWLVYGMAFLLALLIRITCYTGLEGSDDFFYSYFSQLLAHGICRLQPLAFPISDHLGLRTGLTIPVAIIYRIFGISEWGTVAVPLLASAASVPLVLAIGRRIFPARAALLAGFLMLTFPVYLRYATILVPEPVMEMCLLLGVLSFLIAMDKGKISIGFLAGICFGAAYLAKELGVFAGGSLVLYSLMRKQWRLGLATAAGMALVGAFETACYFIQTGDLLYRAHVLGATQASWYTNRPILVAWRLFKAYPRLMLTPSLDFGFHSLVCLVLAGAALLKIRGKAVWLLVIWGTVPMLYLNFGSVSFSRYLPSPWHSRYIGLVYVPVFLLAGALLHKWMLSSKAMRSLCWATVWLVAISGFSCAFWTRGQEHLSGVMASLRRAEKVAERRQLPIVRVEGKDAVLWRFALNILSSPGPEKGKCGDDCLVVLPDALGQPYVMRVPGARPEQEPTGTPRPPEIPTPDKGGSVPFRFR